MNGADPQEHQAIPTGVLIAAAAEPVSLLDGVRVIDVGDEASAYGATLLAEAGAEVVRIEDSQGDAIRRERWRDLTHNVGKRSIALAASTTDLPAEVTEIVKHADLIVGPLVASPLATAVLEAGADVAQVAVVDRRDRPPRPTTDLTAMAAGGHLTLNGDPRFAPMVPAGELAWKQTSLAVFYAGAALLRGAVRGAVGASVEISVQEAVNFTTLQTANSNHYTWHRHVPDRHIRPADFTTVQAADGAWVSFTIHPPNWHRFVEWAESVLGPIGLSGPEWDDPEYVLRAREVVGRHVTALAASLDAAELIDHGQALGLLVLPVHDAAGVGADPHLAARDFWEEVDTPTGPLPVPGSPFRTSAGRARRGRLPALGELDPASLAPNPPPTPRVPATPPDHSFEPHQPLAGVRVIDFCWAIAGTLTTRLLASLGADVIKLESEHRFDPIRLIGPQPGETKSLNTNGVYNDCNANKRAVTINVDSPEGRDLAWQLIEGADVVTANYSPERLDVWGFGWEQLRARNPRLVVANMAVMGMSGPNLGWRSYGTGIVAMCGLARHSNPDDLIPDCLGTLHTDFTVPFMAAGEIIAALERRDRTGEGLYLELAQYETAVRLMDSEVAAALNGDPPGPRVANRSHRHAPNVVLPARGDDEWIAVACRDDADFAALQQIVPGIEGLDRWRDQDRVEAVIAEWTSSREKFDAASTLAAAGVPAAAVETLADHRMPDSALFDYWSPDEHDGIASTVVNLPLTWDGERLPVRSAPDWFGSTVEVVMGELGVEPDRFAELVAQNVLW